MPGLERAQPFDIMYGYDYNRVVDALNNQRGSASVSLAGIIVLGFGLQPVDPNYNARFRFLIPVNLTTVSKLTVSFTLQPFHSGGGATSTGASTHSHSLASPTGAGALTVTLGEDGTGKLTGSGGAVTPISVGPEYTSGSMVSGAPSGATTGTSHSHTVPAVAAVQETGMAQGVHLLVDGVDRTVVLGGPWGSGTALDVTDLDITNWVSTTGWHECQLSSTALGGVTAQLRMQGAINPTV